METPLLVMAGLMNQVRVNQVRQGTFDGLPIFVKRRRPGARIIVWLGNRFLALAQAGCCMLVRADEWAAWEVHCARLLYPERRAVQIGPGPSVIVPAVGGTSLRHLLQCNEADGTAFAAAARELRRVHQLQCSHYQAEWSHGDLHLDNILYDPVDGRAVLLDFDTRHHFGACQTWRHSDDLKVMLLELIGWSDDRWQPLATALLESYGDATVLTELGRQLLVPHGFAKILWYTRTNCASARQLTPRLRTLRAIIQRLAAAAITATSTHPCRAAE